MISKELLIKQVGAQFMSMMSASEEKAQGLISELTSHRDNIEDIRRQKEEIVKQLILIDMMKSDLLIKLMNTNTELSQAKEDLSNKEKELRQQQVHRLYPELFMKGAFEYTKEIDSVNGSNYKEGF